MSDPIPNIRGKRPAFTTVRPAAAPAAETPAGIIEDLRARGITVHTDGVRVWPEPKGTTKEISDALNTLDPAEVAAMSGGMVTNAAAATPPSPVVVPASDSSDPSPFNP